MSSWSAMLRTLFFSTLVLWGNSVAAQTPPLAPPGSAQINTLLGFSGPRVVLEDFLYVAGPDSNRFLSYSLAEVLRLGLIEYRDAHEIDIIERRKLWRTYNSLGLEPPKDEKDPSRRPFNPRVYAALDADFVVKGTVASIEGGELRLQMVLRDLRSGFNASTKETAFLPQKFLLTQSLEMGPEMANVVRTEIRRRWLGTPKNRKKVLVACIDPYQGNLDSPNSKHAVAKRKLARELGTYLALRISNLTRLDAKFEQLPSEACNNPAHTGKWTFKNKNYNIMLRGFVSKLDDGSFEYLPTIAFSGIENLALQVRRLELQRIKVKKDHIAEFFDQAFQVARGVLDIATTSKNEWNIERLRDLLKPSRQDIAQHLDAARALLKAGEYKLGVSRLEYILSFKDSESSQDRPFQLVIAETHYELARAIADNNPYADADAQYERAEKAIESFLSAETMGDDKRNLALFLQRLIKIERAINVSLTDDEEKALADLKGYFDYDVYKKLQQDMLNNLTIPELYSYYYERMVTANQTYGILLFFIDDFTAASIQFEVLRRLRPDSLNISAGYAVSLANSNKFKEAEAAIEWALAKPGWQSDEDLKDIREDILSDHMMAKLKAQDFDAALAISERLLNVSDYKSEIYIEKANIYLQQARMGSDLKAFALEKQSCDSAFLFSGKPALCNYVETLKESLQILSGNKDKQSEEYHNRKLQLSNALIITNNYNEAQKQLDDILVRPADSKKGGRGSPDRSTVLAQYQKLVLGVLEGKVDQDALQNFKSLETSPYTAGRWDNSLIEEYVGMRLADQDQSRLEQFKEVTGKLF